MTFIIPKLLYICLYSLYGSAIAYLSIFYSEVLHLTSNQIGIILAIAPFVQVVACPLWTSIADKYPKLHGPLMGILAMIGGSSVLALYFIPPEWISTVTSLEEEAGELDDRNNNRVMMITTLCAFVFAFFGSPSCALVDSAVLKILGDQKLLYGSQRLWGSVSNGLHILVVGLLISKNSINISFNIFFVGLVSFVIISFFVRFDQQIINNITTHDISDNGSSRNMMDNRGGKRDEERRSLFLASRNYMYDPSMATTTAWSHQNQQQITRPPPFLDSRRESQASTSQYTTSRRRSSASIAGNTLYLSTTVRTYCPSLFNAFLTNTPTTSLMALDVQMEANNELEQQLEQQHRRRNSSTSTRYSFPQAPPPLGLVLSYIPTIDTSLSVFSALLVSNGTNLEEAEEGDNIGIILPDKSILKSLLVYTFMISILLYGIAHSMISQFLFLLLKTLGMNPFIIGLTGPIGGMAEVMTFRFSRQLFDKYSVTKLMTLAYLSFILRAIIYTCLNSYETKSIIVALLLQIINGFAYALIWSTAVSEVDTFFPIEQRSMAQGILAALFSGLGYGIGCILGGYILGVYGSIKLFQASIIICSTSLIVFLSGRRRIVI